MYLCIIPFDCKGLPPWIGDEIAKIGLNVLLELTADATYPYTPSSISNRQQFIV